MIDEKCIFCLIGAGKVQSAKVYDDDSCSAFLDISPASKGHIQVISKEHAPLISLLDDKIKSKMFNIALSIGQKLVEKLNASGVSYIINEGAGAGQKVAHASINVIPRFDGDNLNLSWEGIKMDEKALIEYVNSIISLLSSEAPKKEVVKPTPKVEEKKVEKPKEVKKESNKEKDDSVVIKERIPKYW